MHLSSSLLFWLLGFALILWGGMKVLVVAFGRSILWGLATLFVPFANLLFVCTHWKETKSGFLMGFGGFAMCLGIVLCNPGLQTEVRELAHLPGQRAAEDLTTEIEKKRAQLDAQNAAFATDGAQLSKEYAALEARRKALKPGNAEETAKFNADAAAYQARTTQRKEVYAGIEATQRELDALLALRSRVAVRSGSGQPQVVMYTMPGCSACQMAKQHLAQKGVSYQEIDIEASRENREAFDRAGGTGLPLILIGKKRMEGFDAQWLDALL